MLLACVTAGLCISFFAWTNDATHSSICTHAHLYRALVHKPWFDCSAFIPFRTPEYVGTLLVQALVKKWVPHLLIQVLQLRPWQLELGDLREHHIPAPLLDVWDKVFQAVHSVQRYLALVLQERKGVFMCTFDCNSTPYERTRCTWTHTRKAPW